MGTLEELRWDNLALRALPLDDTPFEGTRDRVEGACFAIVEPTPVNNPRLALASLDALALLGLNPDQITRPEFVQYFAGNKVMPGARTAAHCYCGHQFGHFSGQLGDGATMYLGEVLNDKGERWELQFKGAGPTPFSRRGDGRKVFRSSLREFLCSEHMHALGVPTTRAPTIIISNSTVRSRMRACAYARPPARPHARTPALPHARLQVVRDIRYDGNAQHERCSVITRTAPTFLRFGSFEICKPQDAITGRAGPSSAHSALADSLIGGLIDYSIDTFYPDVAAAHADRTDRYVAFFAEVVARTARLVAGWQAVGWCHGVLNTDNMSIVGVTIDYGPFGFMERYDPDFVCNTSDEEGRYTYKRQPEMCKWNCGVLAESLTTSGRVELVALQAALEATWDVEFKKAYSERFRNKLGLVRLHLDSDEKLVEEFLQAMHETGADFTRAFRSLARISASATEQAAVDVLLQSVCGFEEMVRARKPRLDERQLGVMLQMDRGQIMMLCQAMGINPQQILGELDKHQEYIEYKDTASADSKRKADRSSWARWARAYIDRLKSELDGLSDADARAAEAERIRRMNSANPTVVLKNYVAQIAIDKVEKEDDFEAARKIFDVLLSPYAERDVDAAPASEPGACSLAKPAWASDLVVT